MAWEWFIKYRVWKLALLRRHDFAMTPTTKRWGIGWRASYIGCDGSTYSNWYCWKEIP